MNNSEADVITYPIPIPKISKKYYYILYLGFIFLTVLAQILFDFWVITGAILSITLFIIIILEVDIRLFSPIEVQLSNESIKIKYLLSKSVEKKWTDIQWLNLWPGDDFWSPYSSLKFSDGKLGSIELNYESGRKIKEMYQSITGNKLLNYEEFLKNTNGVRWFTSGPSE
ncbi:MAG TPA: hypothetical protein VMW85_04175 [Methanomassiliicoccales archaeon]|nr:hypothetical protein [Methanomassiliicoccales archaeon]